MKCVVLLVAELNHLGNKRSENTKWNNWLTRSDNATTAKGNGWRAHGSILPHFHSFKFELVAVYIRCRPGQHFDIILPGSTAANLTRSFSTELT